MADELLRQYERELAYLRKLGAGFARAHPKIAGRLRLSGDAIEDPHVSRLVESVAFLNARVRRKLDDDFPELTDAILGVLYPHLLAPTPSMAIVRLEPDPEATSPFEVPAGTMLETDPSYGTPCQFRTCYPVTSWPIEVREARLVGAPFRAPNGPHTAVSRAVLQLTLACTNRGTTLRDLGPGRLRFFLRGDQAASSGLYELLFNAALGVAFATSPSDPEPVHAGPEALGQVGFERHEGLLPYSGRSSLSYRLLSEYFALPAKFLFFDLEGIPRHKLGELDETFEVFVYLSHSSHDLEQSVDRSSLALGCTPVVNLFRKQGEPIQLTHTDPEYHLLADARQALGVEIYGVEKVTALSRDGRKQEFLPFYGIDHAAQGTAEDTEPAYWLTARRPAPQTEGVKDEGTELYLSLVDLSHRTAVPEDWVLMTELTCLNRDLPSKLPFGGGHPRLEFSEGGGSIRAVECLTPPTPTRRLDRGRAALWRLISQLSLNHVSLASGTEGPVALRELLRLNDPVETAETRNVIDSIIGLRTEHRMMRVLSGGLPGLCRGLDVTLELDEKRLGSSGLFLFASVLERFLSSYCSVNSFVQVRLTTNAREGTVRTWAPRAGSRQLV